MPPNEHDTEYELTATPNTRSGGRVRRHARPARHFDVWVRELRLIQQLLRRDMARQDLSLREAARRAGISIGSFHYILDPERITDSAKRPKRHMRHATLLQLRQIAWLGHRTARVLDARIVASAERSRVRR